ncbi:MAG: DUF134 domain-containing protein [Ruminococcaceae bacterium]|nr:DUF134 domain-containing protein [Oscillospiraceae bacterium]
MPRPRKCRKVCCLPRVNQFAPVNTDEVSDEIIIMTVDEYESIRLIDNEGFTQEQCSEYMKVARTTAQQIYNNARRKVARALVMGLTLRIEGGEYQLCSGEETYCACGGCRKHRRACEIKEGMQ